MNKFEFEKLLDECLTSLEQGESLDLILGRNAAQRDRLEPLLKAAQRTREFSDPGFTSPAFNAGRARLLAEAASMDRDQLFLKNGTKPAFSRYSGWKRFIRDLFIGKEIENMKLAPRFALYVLATVLIASFFTVNASASSLPGDSLYSVKLSWEQLRLALSLSDDARLELENEFEQERLSEVEALISTGRQEEVEFTGPIESIAETWVINGISVLVTSQTEVKGAFEIGDLVKVEAFIQADGILVAREIKAAGLDLVTSGEENTPDDSQEDSLDGSTDDSMEDSSDDSLDDSSDDSLDDSSDDSMDDSSDDSMDDSSNDSLDDSSGSSHSGSDDSSGSGSSDSEDGSDKDED